MQKHNLITVPAGKRPKHVLKPDKSYLQRIKAFIFTYFPKRLAFVFLSSLIIIPLMALVSYLNGFVYFVTLNDYNLGIVRDEKEIESFLDELTTRSGDYYGMEATFGDQIVYSKQYNPEITPNPDQVKERIRQNISLLIRAYMVTVNGEPVLPVRSEEDLEIIIDALKSKYSINDNNTRVVDAYVLEAIDLEPCNVPPVMITEPELIASMLSKEEESFSMHVAATAGSYSFTPSVNWQDKQAGDGRLTLSSVTIDSAPDFTQVPVPLSAPNVNVRTLEEVTVIESIPYPVEYVYDPELWIVQREILEPGQEGSREIIYYLTRENGIEIERTKISEEILREPVTQLEARGTARVPSFGTGRFIWPVEGGGEVTPGRGFSAWHTGIDIGAAQGVNIFAADSGVVWFSGYGRTQGNYIIIYHGTYWTLYLHNSINLVHQGREVAQGEVIGKVGSTGRSTGPHLHYEIRIDDGSGEWYTYYQHKPVDPLMFYRP